MITIEDCGLQAQARPAIASSIVAAAVITAIELFFLTVGSLSLSAQILLNCAFWTP